MCPEFLEKLSPFQSPSSYWISEGSFHSILNPLIQHSENPRLSLMLERYHSQRSVLEPDLILSQPESTKKIDILQYIFSCK